MRVLEELLKAKVPRSLGSHIWSASQCLAIDSAEQRRSQRRRLARLFRVSLVASSHSRLKLHVRVLEPAVACAPIDLRNASGTQSAKHKIDLRSRVCGLPIPHCSSLESTRGDEAGCRLFVVPQSSRDLTTVSCPPIRGKALDQRSGSTAW